MALLLGVVALFLAGGCSGDDAPGASATPSVSAEPEEPPDVAVDIDDTPGAGALLVESFTSPGPLIEGGNDLAWTVAIGEWTVQDGQLRHDGAVGALGSVAVVNMESPNGLVQARLEAPADWAGLVFRYIDAKRFWAVVAGPSFGTWNLVKVVDGVPLELANLGIAAVDAGTTVGVYLDGDIISVAINGSVLLSVVDDSYSSAEAAGFYAGQTVANEARWDEFVTIPGRVAANTRPDAPPTPVATATPTAVPSPQLPTFDLGIPSPTSTVPPASSQQPTIESEILPTSTATAGQ